MSPETASQEDAGRTSRRRGPSWYALFVLSSWFVLASLFWWVEIDGRPAGLMAAFRHGAPLWMASVPAIGLVSLVALLWNRPGAYWVLFHLIIPGGIAGLLSAGVISERIAGLSVGLGLGLSLPAGMLYGLIATFAAAQDALPMGSPLTRWVYLGRYRHLESLYALATRCSWRARGPEGPLHTLSAMGTWHDRPAVVASLAKYGAQGSGYVLEVSLVPRREPWRFEVPAGLAKPHKKRRASAIQGACRNASGGQTRVYLWPPGDQVASQEAVRALRQALSSGARFLRRRTMVFSHQYGLTFRQGPALRMTQGAQEIEQLLHWLSGIAEVIEHQGLSTAYPSIVQELSDRDL